MPEALGMQLSMVCPGYHSTSWWVSILGCPRSATKKPFMHDLSELSVVGSALDCLRWWFPACSQDTA